MKRIVCVLLFLVSIGFSQAPDWFSDPVPPRVVLGGDAGMFRISHFDFEDIYTDRWGPSYSGFAGVRVFSHYYATFSYGRFEKDGKENIAADDGSAPDPHWTETWYKIGVQMHPRVREKLGSFYGFGFAIYQIDENEPLRLFSADRGQGFYMELGADYALHQTASLYFKISISSGGERDRSGFESQSIGGYRFSLGLSVWPF